MKSTSYAIFRHFCRGSLLSLNCIRRSADRGCVWLLAATWKGDLSEMRQLCPSLFHATSGGPLKQVMRLIPLQLTASDSWTGKYPGDRGGGSWRPFSYLKEPGGHLPCFINAGWCRPPACHFSTAARRPCSHLLFSSICILLGGFLYFRPAFQLGIRYKEAFPSGTSGKELACQDSSPSSHQGRPACK
ncbi:unnamed protein product [Rangifer tarandus platyrhynchus]|uniref:Uncharacterized protein n=2 Tax=Rangifer tarandus platyrhynchus TaxID=3082113 RepID=A0AC59Z259_RANTA|nr:unnamed protein product [Rangifer tarandus platyrhynchus]